MKQYVNQYDGALDILTDGMLDTSDIEPYMSDIVEALKKQIPARPKDVYYDHFGLAIGMCPVCFDQVCRISLYCNMCGQRLDWEDV